MWAIEYYDDDRWNTERLFATEQQAQLAWDDAEREAQLAWGDPYGGPCNRRLIFVKEEAFA